MFFSYRHMGIQGVVLKDHSNVPITGLHLIHALAVDIQFSPAEIFQSCYHTQGCGFSAAGGTYKNNKFIVLYLQVKILHCFKSVFISFTHMLFVAVSAVIKSQSVKLIQTDLRIG